MHCLRLDIYLNDISSVSKLFIFKIHRRLDTCVFECDMDKNVLSNYDMGVQSVFFFEELRVYWFRL